MAVSEVAPLGSIGAASTPEGSTCSWPPSVSPCAESTARGSFVARPTDAPDAVATTSLPPRVTSLLVAATRFGVGLCDSSTLTPEIAVPETLRIVVVTVTYVSPACHEKSRSNSTPGSGCPVTRSHDASGDTRTDDTTGNVTVPGRPCAL